MDGMPSKEGGYDRTGSRTPMQWDHSANAGFSSAAPANLYLPIDPDAERPTVEKQLTDPDSLLNMVKSLIHLRSEHPALLSGSDIRFLYAKPHAFPFVYERLHETETLTIILNPSTKESDCPLEACPGEVLFSYGQAAKWENGVLTVPSCSFTICRREN